MSKRNRSGNQKRTNPQPLSVEREHRGDHRSDAAQQRGRPINEPRHRRLTLFFNGIVAAFTVIVAVATGWQGYVANRNLKLLQSQQRAWLLPDSAAKISFAPEMPIEVPVMWRNSGQTPAFGAVLTCVTRTLRNDEEFLPDYTGEKGLGAASQMMIAPAQQVPQGCGTTGLSRAEVEEIISGTRRFYVYGKARYRDVFDVPRHTTFCMWLDPSGSSAVACPTYNDAD